MGLVTLRIIDGADRGHVYESLPTPITIGREEGNTVQLNDERISRYHLKIQEDEGKLVLTDLESTNGTKVNGETVQLWILRYGDVISLGRSSMLLGSREQIARRLAELRGVDMSQGVELEDEDDPAHPSVSLDDELEWTGDPDARATLHTLLPPDLPDDLTPGQAAQLCELLQYYHVRIRQLLNSVHAVAKSERLTLEARQWQALLDIQTHITQSLRLVGDPDQGEL